MLHSFLGGQYAETGYSAYTHLHTPHYQASSSSASNSELENLLNPPHPSTLLLPSSQRQPLRSQSGNSHFKKAAKASARNISILSTLIADEEHIASRKSNIARFGSTWIRPPGVQKTKQSMDDEELELKEQEEAMRREEAAREAREAQERLEMQNQAMGGDAAGDAGAEVEEERDLDQDVPEAEAEIGSEGDYEDEGGMMEEDEQGERDLDDDVPEAGSYEHTDTEVEESSDVEDTSEILPDQRMQPAARLTGLDGQHSPSLRSSLIGTPQSLGLDSSTLLSSPTAPRGRPAPGRQGR